MSDTEKKYLTIDECENRGVYRISSRNLSVGVFRKETSGFVGIREKFGDMFLFEEAHFDTGAPFGTVFPKEKIGQLPDDIELTEYSDTVDQKTGKPVLYDYTPDENGNGTQFRADKDGKAETYRVKGWCWQDTGEPDTSIRSMAVMNQKLFDFLKTLRR